MHRTYTFGNTEIAYILLRADTGAVKITVEFEHGVEVVAPVHLTQPQIDRILHKKAPWILEKLSDFEAIEDTPQPKEFLSGEKFLYLGRAHRLIVEEREMREPFVVMHQNELVATVKPDLSEWERRETVRDALQMWYVQQAEQLFRVRVREYEQKLNLRASDVQVVDMIRRWGSCTPKGAIRLNWKLIMAPMHIIDYLVVHELCHTQIADHSPAYWDLLASFMPDYEDRREWLRINGPTLTL